MRIEDCPERPSCTVSTCSTMPPGPMRAEDEELYEAAPRPPVWENEELQVLYEELCRLLRGRRCCSSLAQCTVLELCSLPVVPQNSSVNIERTSS